MRFRALGPLEFTVDRRSVILDFTPFRSPGTITDALCRLMLDGSLPTSLQWVSGLLALADGFQQTPGTGIIEIPFRKGVRVARVIRDSQTKQSLPGVWVSVSTILAGIRTRWIESAPVHASSGRRSASFAAADNLCSSPTHSLLRQRHITECR